MRRRKPNLDPEGNLRTVPVKLDGRHKGIVVMHSPQEHERLWAGVDREVALAIADDGTCSCSQEAYRLGGEALLEAEREQSRIDDEKRAS